jgi:hypothetical protein
VLAKWQTFAIVGLSRSVPMILDISGKAAHALRQYLQLVVTNYELAVDEQNAKDRQRYLIAGWHAASAAATHVGAHSLKGTNGFLLTHDKELELPEDLREKKQPQSQGAAD